MTSQEYWKKRESAQRKHNITEEKEYQKRIQKIFQNMQDEITKEINGFYVKYARKEGITLAEAKKKVSQLDIEEYARKAAKYVKEKDFSKQANEEMRLYNATMKINRLELLKANIGLEMVSGFDELQQFFDETLTKRAMDEFQRQAGILGVTIQDNAKAADALVNASFQNATFSDRVWMYQDMLKAELANLLQTGLIRGQHPRKLATHLKKRFGVSQYNAERLMITELARVQTEAQKLAFERTDYEEYQFHALGTACGACRALDQKHFPVKDMMPGENAPPMHPHCRCSTSAYMDRAAFDKWLEEQKSRLTLNEKAAVVRYISPDAYSLNDKLRRNANSELTDIEREWIKNLDAALEKLPTYKGNLNRSVTFAFKEDAQEFFDEFEVEKEYIPKQYLSTTKSGVYNDDAQVQIYIQNAKNGKDLRELNDMENEVLYPYMAKFKVINKVKENGKFYILLEELE